MKNSYSFANVPNVPVPRSLFRRNHNLKTTINTDFLYPIYVDEALPGDVFKFREHLFARLSTPLTPIMDNLYLDTFYFCVPYRLVDKDFKRFMGEMPFGTPPGDTPAAPSISLGDNGVASGSLSDYLGIPLGVTGEIVPWFHRAYNLVFNEWFRDENLVPARPIAGLHEDGTESEETIDDYVLCRRGKRKDYFTGALPWPMKGTVPAFTFGQVPVRDGVIPDPSATRGDNTFLMNIRTSTGALASAGTLGVGSSGNISSRGTTPSGSVTGAYFALYADLSSVNGFTVNDLREVIATQHLFEDLNRFGSRYIELIRGAFNVISPDARLQRPEFLGGSSRPLNVTTVAQTSQSTVESPQGNLAAFITGSNECFWTKTFTEHCIVLGIANIRADLSYQQGLPRMFTRFDRFDFYWPELANLGEQPVYNREIFMQGMDVTDPTDDEPIDGKVFGYQERWAEYRYHPNTITGQFRSTAPLTLDYWHLAQKFDELPVLGQTFIEEHVPIDRVLALSTATAPNMILDGWFECDCVRPMPLYSVPGLNRL